MKVQNILVVQVAGWAESCLSSFLPDALRENFSGSKITLLTGQSLGPWTSSLHYDDVILADDQAMASKSLPSIWELGRLAVTLRGRGFDLGLCLTPGRRFGQLMKWGGVKKTAGFSLGHSRESDEAFDVTIPFSENIDTVGHYVKLLETLDIKPLKLNFRLKVRTHVHEDIMRRLAGIEIRSKNFVALAPGGGENPQRKFHNKRWSHYSEIIRLFIERTKFPLLLLGGLEDLSLVDKLTSIEPSRVYSWIGKTTREEALATVGEAQAFIGNDSGLAHVAGAAGTPSVILFGPTSSRIRAPVGKDRSALCIDSTLPCSPCARNDGSFDWGCRDNVCLKTISPEQVWQGYLKITGTSQIAIPVLQK